MLSDAFILWRSGYINFSMEYCKACQSTFAGKGPYRYQNLVPDDRGLFRSRSHTDLHVTEKIEILMDNRSIAKSRCSILSKGGVV
jgi:hypothetical protein